ncbi:MAG: hypothetical protein Q7T73_18490 [Beijerinckiaceae bacterium]|nr:hypothetical protein [Beijerinckiaceae bacterium]
MSYTSSNSHLAAISHDPLETGYENSRRARLSDYSRPYAGPDTIRPLLLAGALGLFAAWVVSGATFSGSPARAGRPYRGRGYVPADSLSPPSQARARPGVVPPEGRSSNREFEMDAMNP